MDKLALLVKFVVFAVTLFWAMAVTITPYLEPTGTIGFDDEGVVGEHEHAGQVRNMSTSFAKWVYNGGDGACHQRASRSFFLNGNQMPYCARCTAIFTGLAVGMTVVLFIFIDDIKWWLLVIGFVPLGIDGTVQLVTTYESNNILRLVTGMLAGIVTSILIGFIIEEYVKLYREHKERKWLANQDAGRQAGTLEEDIQPPIEQNRMFKK